MTLAATELPEPAVATPYAAFRRAGRVASNVTTTLMTVVLAVVAALAVVIAAVTHFSPVGQYTVFTHPVLTVLSGSMTPAIRTGDLIVDQRLSAAQAGHLHVGQIITFQADATQTITHRIVGVVTSPQGAVAYRTKGDANNAADSSLRPASSVIGLFETRVPKGGYILNALHHPSVLGLLLAAPLLWFVSGPLFRLAREAEEAERQVPACDAGEAEGETP